MKGFQQWNWFLQEVVSVLSLATSRFWVLGVQRVIILRTDQVTLPLRHSMAPH